jgi:hypothetical protein
MDGLKSPLTQFTGIARVWTHLVLGKTGLDAYTVFVPSGASASGELELLRISGIFPRLNAWERAQGMHSVARSSVAAEHPKVSHTACLKNADVRRERKGERNGK